MQHGGWLAVGALAFVASAGCYETHLPFGSAGVEDSTDPFAPVAGAGGRPVPPTVPRPGEPTIPQRPPFPRPMLPPIECSSRPAAECSASFPRIMIVMDASSSMLAGRSPGENNWDKARFALAGNPRAPHPDDPGYLQPAFARELEVRGHLVTMEDVVHLGMVVFNARDEQRVVLQYAPCAVDNLAWSMNPYVSCEPPGCTDPYGDDPLWTYKNSDFDRDPPFVHTTFSYTPPCNPGGPVPCIGSTYNTYTAEGLQLAAENREAYLRGAGGSALSRSTRFATILITDGDTSPDSFPEDVLVRMAAMGVPTYVIGLAPQGPAANPEAALAQLDRYAELGGTQLATLVRADERDIADAFFAAATRIIDEIGTDPCCQPNDCSANPEPAAPQPAQSPVGEIRNSRTRGILRSASARRLAFTGSDVRKIIRYSYSVPLAMTR